MARKLRDGGLVRCSGTSPLSDVTSAVNRGISRLPMRINAAGACGQDGSTLDNQQGAPFDTLPDIDEFVTALRKRLYDSHSNLTLEIGTAAKLRLEAWMDRRTEREHRKLWLGLSFDDRGTPSFRGIPAGVDSVLELTPI